jgi:hypothetical protein
MFLRPEMIPSMRMIRQTPLEMLIARMGCDEE